MARMPILNASVIIACIALAGSFTFLGLAVAQQHTVVRATSSMIVTNNHWASEAAQEIVSSGGNAFDAAIAAGFVLGLTEPGSSGIGGGGYALTYTISHHQKWAYDGRETAPHSAHSEWFLDANGKPMDFMQAVVSAKSVGVPSEIALFYKLHEELGKLPWNQLMVPAIRIAKNGYPMSPLLHTFLVDHESILKNNQDVRKIFFSGNQVKAVGMIIRNPDYANTLTRIAKNPRGFYQGKLAEELINKINHEANENLFNLADFSNYRIRRYPVLCKTFRLKYEICSIPPSSSGGIAVQELLGIYAHRYSGHEYSDPQWMYYFIEAAKLVYADRNQYIADPDFEKSPVTGLLSEKYWIERSKQIGETAMPTPVAAGLPEGANTHYAPDASIKIPGTTSIAIVDPEGNAISMTLTIEGPFGSHIFTHGFFLNNELTDFSFTPKDEHGRWIANRVAPGKRPRSSISPVMVFDKNRDLYIISGSPGGSKIICYVAKNLILMLDMNMPPARASASPNLCAMNSLPEIENIALPSFTINALRTRGEKIIRENMLSGVTNIRRKSEGGWSGAADPRREGLAIGSGS